MRAELDSLNHCAVPFLSRGTTNLYWYYNIAKLQKLACSFLLTAPVSFVQRKRQETYQQLLNCCINCNINFYL